MQGIPEIDISEYRQVGIVGIPPLTVIRALNENRIKIHDLDARLVSESIDGVSPLLPKVYCAILRTVVLNAMHLPLDAIFIDVGPGKCDSALHVSTILKEILSIPVIRTKNIDTAGFGTPLSKARHDLTEKMMAITEGVKTALPGPCQYKPCKPRAGFWGVPPRDFSILESFPTTTHVYGWTRCMENKTPADETLESYCNLKVPTVFFAQSFCAKTALAKFLADRHPMALYLDVDFHTSNSARAKVQAFLELSGALS
ncbi:MAG: hypothetical protein KKD63_13950 [Proteobacteria bacterium]|nr:hypothetical protein [Desulfobulbaceae bacterium]MBU4153972.1 hypothetical protein [Pseudomonadota bacterium]